MVYCGKPSTGCQSCRERKTRCDKATPSCSQCIRAHRTCPGYRNQLDLMFRIENKSVIQKSKSKQVSRFKTSSKPATPAPSALQTETALEVPNPTEDEEVFKLPSNPAKRPDTYSIDMALSPTYRLSPTLQQRAQGFFAANSVMWNPTFSLAETLCTPSAGDDHLLASINAVGMASYSNSVHSSELMVQARRDYVQALRLTNAALRSPATVKKDSTLFAVMILSIFETIAATNQHSLVAWTEHIDGAAALVKIRGRPQFKTEAGRRMFQQVTSNLMISCMTRNTPMPAHMIELRQYVSGMLDTEDPAWKLSEIIVDFTVFRSAVRTLQMAGPRRVLEAALKIDQRFLDVVKDIKKLWPYETVYTNENPHMVWNKCYHVYTDAFSSQIWNGMRTCRILLHELIRDQLVISSAAMNPIFMDAEAASQSDSSVQIMLEMQAEILAGVPQHNHHPLKDGPSTHSLTYFILWPLYLVGVMDLSSDPIRRWVIQRLRSIADEGGIQQAAIMAEFMERKELLDPWDQRTILDRDQPKPTIMNDVTTREMSPQGPFDIKVHEEIIREADLWGS